MIIQLRVQVHLLGTFIIFSVYDLSITHINIDEQMHKIIIIKNNDLIDSWTIVDFCFCFCLFVCFFFCFIMFKWLKFNEMKNNRGVSCNWPPERGLCPLQHYAISNLN